MSKVKIILVGVIFTLICIFSTSVVSAQSLIIIKNDGRIVTTVLGTQDSKLNIPQSENLTVQKVATGADINNAKVSLFKEGESIKLAYITSLKDGLFKVEQVDTFVTTKYPIDVDPETKKISVKTESGIKYLSILPKEAVDILLRAKIVNSINSDSENSLEDSDGVLVYKLTGSKKVNLFNVTDYETNVEAKINASTGEIIHTNEPVWLKLLSFFLK
ncbi:PepSY domain-containing protein [Candidatus Microgenomates bacterium]|nr:PepSY domain-containing protein [Candidatus Microgenomates bacterium]